MTKTTIIKIFILKALFMLSLNVTAQELYDLGDKSESDSLSKTTLRPKMALLFGAGSTLMNSDFGNPDYENFLKLQLKRFITSQIAVSGNLKKFDIDNYDFKAEGFLSGDLNIEWFILPQNKVTPFIYAGAGILISNDFDDKNYKAQGGIGLDALISNNISLVCSIEANYVYDEQNGSQLLQEADGLYYNAAIGVKFYFGNRNNSSSKRSKKTKKTNKKSTIQSNWIDGTK